jgi:hypothetical protein
MRNYFFPINTTNPPFPFPNPTNFFPEKRLSLSLYVYCLVLEVRVMLQNIISAVTGDGDGNKKMKRETAATAEKCRKIEGSVVLMKKNVLDFNDFNASVLDRVHELLGQKVSLHLISAVNADPSGNYYFFLSSLVNLC